MLSNSILKSDAITENIYKIDDRYLYGNKSYKQIKTYIINWVENICDITQVNNSLFFKHFEKKTNRNMCKRHEETIHQQRS